MSAENTVDDEAATKMALARAIWKTMREAPEDETPEARRNAWENEKVAVRKIAGQVSRRLERAGYAVSKI